MGPADRRDGDPSNVVAIAHDEFEPGVVNASPTSVVAIAHEQSPTKHHLGLIEGPHGQSLQDRSSSDAQSLTGQVNALLEQWRDQRSFGALAAVLPAWIENDFSREGWRRVSNALARVRDGLTFGALRSTLDHLILSIDRLLTKMS